MQIQESYLLLVLQSFDFFNIFNDRNLQFFGSHLIFLKSPQVGKRHRHFTEEKNKYSLDYEMILFSPIVKEMQVKMQCVCVCSVLSDSLQPLGLRPTRLLYPWDSPDKNTGARLPFPTPGNLPNPGIKPETLESPALSSRFFLPLFHLGSPPILHLILAKSPQ